MRSNCGIFCQLAIKGGLILTTLRTHYDNLKVSRDAPESVIRAAYRTLSQQYHPDKRPGDERAVRVMAIINQSYEVLSNPERRREHDAWIAREEQKRKQRAEPSQAPPMPPQRQRPERAAAPKAQDSALTWLAAAPFRLMLRAFRAAPGVVALVVLVGGIWLWGSMTPDQPRRSPSPGTKPYQPTFPVNVPEVAARYERPQSAPNGEAWPNRAGYVSGYPIANDDGRSNVTVDNTRNDSDVFAKLVSLEGETAYPVRQFYIPAHSRFTMSEVSAGTYDLRYRDLASGGLSRSEPFEVVERHTNQGIQYSEMTMTLYKVEGGNFDTFDLAEAEF
jgi:hypothetical protein